MLIHNGWYFFSTLHNCGVIRCGKTAGIFVPMRTNSWLSVPSMAARGGASQAVRATYAGDPGHPVLLEHALFERLRDVSGDHGARNLLLSARVKEVPCEDLGGGEDVDTPAELDALRAGGPVA